LDEVKDYSPFHWVLEFAEVYSKGGFDVIIGNPPWDRLKPLRDDYFSKFDEIFRTRMPDDKDNKQEELLEDDRIRDGWEEYKEEMKRRADYYNNSDKYNLQKPVVDERTIGGGGNDLSALFLERVFELIKKEGYVAQILPGAIYNGASGKDLRTNMLENNQLRSLTIFENKGIFEGLHNQYKFGISVFKSGGVTSKLIGIYEKGYVNILRDIHNHAFEIPKKVLKEYSPEARIFPYLKNKDEVAILNKILDNPPISTKKQSKWFAIPYWELNRTSDRDRFFEDESKGDYPILGGSNIYQYTYTSCFFDDIEAIKLWGINEDKNVNKSAKKRIREKNYRLLKRSIFDSFNGKGSQKKFVDDLLNKKRNKKLTEKDVLLDCTTYRIVFRDVTNATNERTIVASVIPKGYVCVNTLHTIRPYDINPHDEDLNDYPLHNVYKKIFSDKEIFVCVGLINSIPFDYLMRTKIDTHVSMYKFKESQVPRLTEGDDWFEYIWTRAAKLNCYGDEFEEMRERLGGIEAETDFEKRKELQAEIDAAAFHAYCLDKEETKFVLDNFHRVENPRLMTEDYFDMVYDKYLMLEEEGPKP